MKLIKKISMGCMATIICLSSACVPEKHELSGIEFTADDLSEGLAYTVTKDEENPNIVYLKSLLPSSYQVCWEHPQGRSQDNEVTLQIPFEGEYEVKFGVQTRGGLVYGNPATFTIDEFRAEFVQDELWTLLTGGVNQEKVWVFDNGTYGYAAGEMTYADPSVTQEWGNWTANWDPGKDHTGDAEIWGSTMTFDLKGGANVRIHTTSVNGNSDTEGVFMMNTENHTITFTNCELLHTPGWTSKVSNWSINLNILELDENHLRIAVMRDYSGEDPWWLVWNYVSKEFADNYVPEVPPVTEEPEPELPEGWESIISGVTTNNVKWTMSASTPYDWANLDGTFINNFTAGNYPDWAQPQQDLNKLSLTIDYNANQYTFEMPDGTSTTGTYELDEKGIFTFDQTVPTYYIGGNDYVFEGYASAPEKLRVLNVETIDDKISGMWLGALNEAETQYMAYHFTPKPAEGGGSEPQGTLVSVDNSKISLGGNNNTDYRITFYDGAWESPTKLDPPLDPTAIKITQSIKIKFTINGINGSAASTEYPAKLMMTGTGWWPQFYDEVIKINGNGTYTIDYSPGTFNGVLVFLIDIVGMYKDLNNPENVTVTIDEIRVL